MQTNNREKSTAASLNSSTTPTLLLYSGRGFSSSRTTYVSVPSLIRRYEGWGGSVEALREGEKKESEAIGRIDPECH